MKRKIIVLILIVFTTASCIYLGIRTRHNSRLRVTQLAGEGNGYIIETSENNLIVINGGTENDSERLKQIIKEKSPTQSVQAWFLTSVDSEDCGAFRKLMYDEEIKILNNYVSFNSAEWYANANIEQDKLEYINDLLNRIYTDNRDKTVQLARRDEVKIDNLIITALEVADDNRQGLENQNVILNVDNTFKSINFFGNIGKLEQKKFIEDDKDMHKADVVQFSSNGENDVLNYIEYKDAMISEENAQMKLEAENIYIKQNGEALIEVW